ncbi:gamma-glutamylcyclotransferase family protein [Streptomyces sp. DSM 44917]|uniref:Putative gamma-glutamylcyclotransferase n=1 Tax=Streptomyces boetiae TaxID=3075541 RepID=A0ABU2L7V7_9ACTN|nr:gamma-glutamylcyclotransferase family protein [Streptomyces sp. DSM 44917]MDT0307654.1 gamma-glutamylcyclotransferase family protein [Streptomyces sp. DSM 44917]
MTLPPPDRLAAVAPESDALFVYGTLQFPEVLQALLGRVPSRAPASADGWRAASLAGRVYPGLVPSTLTARGLLLTDLTADEWRRLDDFEDDLYDLRQLPLNDGRHGWTYTWSGPDVLPATWQADEFAALHLTSYAARCARIARHRHPRTPTPR